MRVIFLLLGIIIGIVFIIAMFAGQKYDYMIEALDNDDFPLKSIYSAGFYLQEKKLFSLRGNVLRKLHSDMALYYSKLYSDFYTMAVWAQVISFALFFLSFGFILGGLFPGDVSLLAAGSGVLLAVVCVYYFYTKVGSAVNERREKCESEFPNAISKLALIVNSGVILRDAWNMVAYGNEGIFYELMQKASQDMGNGVSDVDAIYEFGYMTNSDDVKKFTSALIQNIERGGGELPYFLEQLSSELWNHHRQTTLQKGEKAASALLIPIALMFLGIMLIVIVAAVQSFSI